MFTEYEIDTMIEIPAVLEATTALKKEFMKEEAPYLDITVNDFFSLVMMVPTVGIAKADGNVSLFEELALNKKARKLSKGGYFMKRDPVVYAMKFIINKYDVWHERFLNVLNVAMKSSFDFESLADENYDNTNNIDYEDYKKKVLNTPYIVIRFITSFFLENDEDILNKDHHIRQSEYVQMIKIGEILELNRLPVFNMFCNTFDQKA
jgi:hypothetical protein